MLRANLPWTCFLALVFLLGVSHATRLLDENSHVTPITPGHELCDRNPRNEALAAFAKQSLRRGHSGRDPLLPQSDSFDGFIKELKASIDRHPLPNRTIDVMFGENNNNFVHPACNGDWMEFGVWMGTSVNKTANFRRKHCHASCPPVFGFDTFTGLPEAWVADDALTFGPGSFSLEGKLPPVASNAFLVKGLFADSIPLLLEQQRMWATGANGSLSAEGYRRWQKENDAPLSYLHIDCDLFIGARDAFTLLNHKIVAGTVILFDELINYNQYKEHEVKALWMWLQETGAKIATIGTWGPLPNTDNETMDAEVQHGYDLRHQSAAFVVISKPGSQTAMWKR